MLSRTTWKEGLALVLACALVSGLVSWGVVAHQAGAPLEGRRVVARSLATWGEARGSGDNAVPGLLVDPAADLLREDTLKRQEQARRHTILWIYYGMETVRDGQDKIMQRLGALDKIPELVRTLEKVLEEAKKAAELAKKAPAATPAAPAQG
eukprot:scaffold8.g1700.t1